MSVLRVDPTRTTLLRRQLEQDLKRRFAQLKKEITHRLVRQDLLSPEVVVNFGEYQFFRIPQRLEEFKQWLKARLGLLVLARQAQQENDNWLQGYIQKVYRKGYERAFSDLKKPPLGKDKLDFYNGTRTEFLHSSFNRPASAEKVKILTSRTYNELEGMSDTIVQVATRILTDGMTRGLSPNVIAKGLNRMIASIGENKAATVARTAIIHAHAEGQLDAFERLGVEEVGAMVELSSAYDNRVCPKCKSLNGKTFTIKEARGVIPVHPRCRCSWIPFVQDVVRPATRTRLQGSISRSLSTTS